MRGLVDAKRRIKVTEDDGVTLVFIAVTILGLLAMAAFAIDFGSIWEERRQLQNGADAAALAIAEDCGRGACPADVYATAEIYVDGNARDGAAWAYNVDMSVPNQVTVYNATENPGGDHLHDLLFAGAVGFGDFTVGADATVVWGYPLQIETLPIIISECEWNKFEAGWPAGGGTLYPDPPNYNTADMAEIQFHDGNATEDCAAVAGQDVDGDNRLEGGFGWLKSPGCVPQVYGATNVDPNNPEYGWVAGDPGSSPASGCTDPGGDVIENLLLDKDVYGNLIPKTIFIPYFDDIWTGPANGSGYCGSNGKCYHIAGYGAFHVTGYRFSGGPQYSRYANPPLSGLPCSGPGQNDIRCMTGYFVNTVYTGGAVLGGEDRGVVVIKFTG